MQNTLLQDCLELSTCSTNIARVAVKIRGFRHDYCMDPIT